MGQDGERGKKEDRRKEMDRTREERRRGVNMKSDRKTDRNVEKH